MKTYNDLTTKQKLRLERARLAVAKAQLRQAKVEEALGLLPTLEEALRAAMHRAVRRGFHPEGNAESES